MYMEVGILFYHHSNPVKLVKLKEGDFHQYMIPPGFWCLNNNKRIPCEINEALEARD